MTDNTKQQFNLEDVVNNTKQASQPAHSQSQNLDSVVVPTQNKPAKTETIDDILTKEKPKKSSKKKGGIITLAALLAVGGGLRRLIKDSKPTDTTTATTTTGTQAETTSGQTTPTKITKKDREDLGGDYKKNTKTQSIFYKEKEISTDLANFAYLGKNYAKDSQNIYYKGEILTSVEADKFKIIENTGEHKLSGIIVNSRNLLEHLKSKQNREFLMTTIASITNTNQNVKNELTQSSVYAMDGFKNEFDQLNKLNRGDDLTNLQRAKFGVIFLYVKLIKNLESDEIRMSKAKEELRYFIAHSDEILKTYGPEQAKNNNISGDIGYDKYCVYQDGKLFTCFLNEIFITAKD